MVATEGQNMIMLNGVTGTGDQPLISKFLWSPAFVFHGSDIGDAPFRFSFS